MLSIPILKHAPLLKVSTIPQIEITSVCLQRWDIEERQVKRKEAIFWLRDIPSKMDNEIFEPLKPLRRLSNVSSARAMWRRWKSYVTEVKEICEPFKVLQHWYVASLREALGQSLEWVFRLGWWAFLKSFSRFCCWLVFLPKILHFLGISPLGVSLFW